MEKILRIGSRESRLAVIQAEIIADRIKKYMPDIKTELVTMKTTGDKILDKTLDKIGGKGLFLKELDMALIDGRVDICVHSLKDVPVEIDDNIPLGAYCARESPSDVLVIPKNCTHWDKTLPAGCSSIRRKMQFNQMYPDIEVRAVRGNVLTRLEKLDSGQYGALILAEAGLKRLNLSDRIFRRFSPDEIVSASGQGIIAVQSRKGEYTSLLTAINDENSAVCAEAERFFSKLVGGDCSAPVGCYACTDGSSITIHGFSGIDGTVRKSSIQGNAKDYLSLTEKLALELI